jgi:hypothetical protein
MRTGSGGDCSEEKALTSRIVSKALGTRLQQGIFADGGRNYSRRIAGVSLPLDGIHASWRVVVSKARLSPRLEQLRSNADIAELGKIRGSPC